MRRCSSSPTILWAQTALGTESNAPFVKNRRPKRGKKEERGLEGVSGMCVCMLHYSAYILVQLPKLRAAGKAVPQKKKHI